MLVACDWNINHGPFEGTQPQYNDDKVRWLPLLRWSKRQKGDERNQRPFSPCLMECCAARRLIPIIRRNVKLRVRVPVSTAAWHVYPQHLRTGTRTRSLKEFYSISNSGVLFRGEPNCNPCLHDICICLFRPLQRETTWNLKNSTLNRTLSYQSLNKIH